MLTLHPDFTDLPFSHSCDPLPQLAPERHLPAKLSFVSQSSLGLLSPHCPQIGRSRRAWRFITCDPPSQSLNGTGEGTLNSGPMPQVRTTLRHYIGSRGTQWGGEGLKLPLWDLPDPTPHVLPASSVSCGGTSINESHLSILFGET